MNRFDQAAGFLKLPTHVAVSAAAIVLAVGLFLGGAEPSTVHAQDSARDSELERRQAALVKRFSRLEELLLRLSEVEAAENPERAAVLKRAAKLARERFILDKLRDASDSLAGGEFRQAMTGQKAAVEELQAMLKLLLSEDRSKRIRDERERIAKLVKELKRTERSQRGTRARTQNGVDLDELRQEQQRLERQSRELSAEFNSQERDEQNSKPSKPAESKPAESKPAESKPAESKPAESKPGESKPGESKPGESKPGESKPGESKPGESKPGESKPGESKPGESKPGESKPGESKPGESKPGESGQPQRQSPESPQTPERQAEEQLEKAIEKMRQAEDELKEANRQGATEAQREAEERLREAIDRLEKILRQLREEEVERELAKLESRLRKMAAMQSKVLDDCIALASTPKSQRDRQTDLKAANLAFDEKKITLEADRAMLLLREEGSSVAFPEVIEQIRGDTVTVSRRLNDAKIDSVTQGIQQDILAALEEMITALQKAQRDLEKKKQQQQQQQQQQQSPGDQPLVQIIAELKLIRTMQTRIKTTTERYDKLLNSGDTDSGELLLLLRDLALRQERLFKITRDLALKRNQ